MTVKNQTALKKGWQSALEILLDRELGDFLSERKLETLTDNLVAFFHTQSKQNCIDSALATKDERATQPVGHWRYRA